MDWIDQLGARVRVHAACDPLMQQPPMIEGTVVGYAPSPTIVVRSDRGAQSDWQVSLPIDVLEPAPVVPAELPFRPENEALAEAFGLMVGAVAYSGRDNAVYRRVCQLLGWTGQGTPDPSWIAVRLSGYVTGRDR